MSVHSAKAGVVERFGGADGDNISARVANLTRSRRRERGGDGVMRRGGVGEQGGGLSLCRGDQDYEGGGAGQKPSAHARERKVLAGEDGSRAGVVGWSSQVARSSLKEVGCIVPLSQRRHTRKSMARFDFRHAKRIVTCCLVRRKFWSKGHGNGVTGTG